MKFVGIDPAMRLNGLAVCVIDDKKYILVGIRIWLHG
jgi:hypothetical protein